MRARFPQLLGRNQVEKIEIEATQDLVRTVQGEQAFAFEDVMEVGLGESGETSETSFSGFAAAYTAAEVVKEPSPQIVEGHRQGYFSEK
jgi:hypothetical protein